MSSLTAMPAYHKIPGETEAAAAPRRKRGGRRLPGGLLIIGAASLILALATAQECHSVTHFPSLLYGLVLWGWWGVVAGTLWQLGPKMPSLLRLSPLRIALHLMAGCVVASSKSYATLRPKKTPMYSSREVLPTQ